MEIWRENMENKERLPLKKSFSVPKITMWACDGGACDSDCVNCGLFCQKKKKKIVVCEKEEKKGHHLLNFEFWCHELYSASHLLLQLSSLPAVNMWRGKWEIFFNFTIPVMYLRQLDLSIWSQPSKFSWRKHWWDPWEKPSGSLMWLETD